MEDNTYFMSRDPLTGTYEVYIKLEGEKASTRFRRMFASLLVMIDPDLEITETGTNGIVKWKSPMLTKQEIFNLYVQLKNHLSAKGYALGKFTTSITIPVCQPVSTKALVPYSGGLSKNLN